HHRESTMATQTRSSFFLALVLLAATLVPSQSARAQKFNVRAELVGTGFALPPQQGYSVALSRDGNTALVGGYLDNSAWVFTLSGAGWTQQGDKLSVDNSQFGISVALSSDGNTALVGGPNDSLGTGAAWVFTRSGGVWSQQAKLVGISVPGATAQG